MSFLSARKILLATAFTAGLAGFAPGAFAGPITGTLTLASNGVVDNGQDLATRNVYSFTTFVAGVGTPNFPASPNAPFFGNGSSTPVTLDLTNLLGFTFSNSTVGTFGSVTSDQIITRSATNLDIYLVGTFTPTFGSPTYGSNAASVRISLNRTGTALSGFTVGGGGTLAAPPAGAGTIPEPATLALLGVGILGLGILRGHRKA